MADTPSQSGQSQSRRNGAQAGNGPQAGNGRIVSGVAGRYASALFELARDTKGLAAVGGDLDRFDAMLRDSEDLRRLVRSPVFTAEEQAQAIGAILERAGVSGLAGNFIRLVATNRRLFALPDMIRAFRELVADARGVVRAQVTLAEQPSPRVMDDIRSALRDVTRAEVDVDLKIDPALIGGLVVKMGSRMIDASLRTQLNSIRLSLKGVR